MKPLDSFVEMSTAYAHRKRDLNEFLWKYHHATVFGGPFKGMRIVPPEVWSNGDIGPMILGSYEAELHPVFEEWRAVRYDAIVNIGSGSGYYAVGLALLFAGVPVIAYEANEAVHGELRRNAEANGVLGRIEQRGAAAPELLAGLLAERRVLMVMDCEGYEEIMIAPATAPLYRNTDLIVECHEHLRPTMAADLAAVLAGSHRTRVIAEGSRNPNLYPPLNQATSVDRWLAICENRPCTMSWLIAGAGSARGE